MENKKDARVKERTDAELDKNLEIMGDVGVIQIELLDLKNHVSAVIGRAMTLLEKPEAKALK